MTVYSNKRRAIIVGPENPVTSKETDVWVNTDTGQILRYNGTSWVIAAADVGYVQTASSYVNVLSNDYSDSQLESASISIINNLVDSNTALQAYINASTIYLENTLNDNIETASVNLAFYTNHSITDASANLSFYTDESIISASTNLINYVDLEILDLQNLTNNNLIITENSLISTINTASIASVSESNDYTDTEIQNLDLTTKLVNASAAAVSYSDSLTTTDIQEGDSLYFTEQRAIDAGSATYLTKSDAVSNYLSFSEGGTITAPVDFTSDVTFSGSVTYLNAENLLVNDPLIYLAQTNTESDALDSGFTTAYGEGDNVGESHLHRGLVYDNSDNTWKLTSNFPHPITNEVDFSSANYDPITLGSASVTGTVSASAFIGDGSQLTGINLATKKDKLVTFDQETSNYILNISNPDQIIEMNVATANTLTVPPNSSVPFPIGTELTILQTGAGQTTLTPGSGVTINGTPGLKLRGQWSSAMLIKRNTDTWVAIGDLSA